MIMKLKDMDMKTYHIIKITYKTDKTPESVKKICYFNGANERISESSSYARLVLDIAHIKDDATKFTKEQATEIVERLERLDRVRETNMGYIFIYDIDIVKRVELSFDDEYPYSSFNDDMDEDTMISLAPVDDPVLVEDWDHMRKLDLKSETHNLEIDDYNAHINSKKEDKQFIYLSTHTFYGMTHKSSTEIMQKCGFNVIIDNWDKDIEGRNPDPDVPIIEEKKTSCTISDEAHSSILNTLDIVIIKIDTRAKAIEKVKTTKSRKSHPYDKVRGHKGRR
jgi:hypothetical protein